MFGTLMQQEWDVLHSWLCTVTLCANRGPPGWQVISLEEPGNVLLSWSFKRGFHWLCDLEHILLRAAIKFLRLHILSPLV